MQFSQLAVSTTILQAVAAEGYSDATPIQAQAIPLVLEGRDVLGCAQTGTGKTAAFAIPILHRLAPQPLPASQGSRKARCLVLCPTRELASQIAASFGAYGKGLHVKYTTIFGGVNQNRQVDALRRGVDVIVATPGRLMDLMEQGYVHLNAIETLVLDEADRMLDMGFIQPIRQIVAKLPANRQTLLFSATMAPEIRRLADSLLRNPAVVNVTPVNAVLPKIEESVYRVDKGDKPALLAHLVKTLPMHRSIVFTKTKHGADRVVRHLYTRGIRAEAIHGNKSQNARQRALASFANNSVAVLVATDIASRGIDVDGITHVVNYDLTHEPETYVHRIGRTGRAGASGSAVSFCDREEVSNLRAIERLIRRPIPPMANPLPAGVAGQREAGNPDASYGASEGGSSDNRDRTRESGRPQRHVAHAETHTPRTHAPRPANRETPRAAHPLRPHAPVAKQAAGRGHSATTPRDYSRGSTAGQGASSHGSAGGARRGGAPNARFRSERPRRPH